MRQCHFKSYLFVYLVATVFIFSDAQAFWTDQPKKINIICLNNLVGLARDRSILEKELSDLGHQVQYVNKNEENNIPSADINIFIEHLHHERFFPYAQQNYFIPNPEWYKESSDLLARCDLILCRTNDSLRIFSEMHPNIYFLNFSSLDRYQENVTKDYFKPLHSIGRSRLKGTDAVIEVWERRLDFTKLTFLQGKRMYQPNSKNIRMSSKLISDNKFIQIQNQHGLHICPSQSEGFGHYILEAMSTGAVVITTDGDPMREHIQDKRFLVRSIHEEDRNLGKKYEIDPIHLEEVVEYTLSLSREELEEIGRQNREFFLKKRDHFRKRLRDLFGEVRSL